MSLIRLRARDWSKSNVASIPDNLTWGIWGERARWGDTEAITTSATLYMATFQMRECAHISLQRRFRFVGRKRRLMKSLIYHRLRFNIESSLQHFISIKTLYMKSISVFCKTISSQHTHACKLEIYNQYKSTLSYFY